MNTSGNTILITGGTSGIGLAFAETFLKEGNKVIITGRRQDRLDEIQARHPEIIIKNSDLMDAAQRRELAVWVVANHPETNVLINNAGVQLITDLTKEVDLDRIHAELETNFTAPLHLATLFVPQLTGKDNAAIINITSGLAYAPVALMAVYCATKAAMYSLGQSLRFQLKDKGIKVFDVAPPSTDTELGHDRRQDKSQSHGGIPVQEFINEAMEAIRADNFDAPIGDAKGIRKDPYAFFERVNDWFKG